MTNTQSSTEILKVDTLGRVRTSKEKREEIIAAYRGSGMTGLPFASYSGVKYSTLMNWVGKERRAHKPVEEICKTSELNWVEAMVEDGGSGQGETLSVEIAGTVRMRVVNRCRKNRFVRMPRSHDRNDPEIPKDVNRLNEIFVAC